jgi:hypothetical protein
MRSWAAVVLSTWVALSAAAAAADTFYKYRDKRSGRDVFVNRLDQVPQKYRGEAQIVLEGADTVTTESPTEEPAERIEVTPESKRPTLKTVRAPAPAAEQVRKALAGNDPWHALPVVAAMVIDAKLAEKGAPPLYANERTQLGDLIVGLVVALLAASLAALVAWIVVFVTALRNGDVLWAILMFLISPLAYLYVFLHGGQGRAVWKTLCTLGMLAPALVGLVGSWRFYAWFAAVIQARGGTW